MLNLEKSELKELLLQGLIGLEKESLRVDENGFMAQTPHPFGDDEHIVRDFCENQTEINTGTHPTVAAAMEELAYHTNRIKEELSHLCPREYLWPSSNPPYIRGEEDIPIAWFEGMESSKTAYRNQLSEKYGRYKMAFCGIHFNYSFSEELLGKAFEKSGYESYQNYKNDFYLSLAKKVSLLGWILTAATAASPILDSSFFQKGTFGKPVFTGFASVRCGELGYWNHFVPVLDYSNLDAYVDSIRAYVNGGLLMSASELYYPVRLKPAGSNQLDLLQTNGVNHIELRMFDLNPLTPVGFDERDALFAQLFLCWLAAMPDVEITDAQQIRAVQNFKEAARFDLDLAKVILPGDSARSVAEAALLLLDKMKEFYHGLDLGNPKIMSVLAFQEKKFEDTCQNYAHQIMEKLLSPPPAAIE